MVCVITTGEKRTLAGENGALATGETDSQHSTGVTVCGFLTHLKWDSGHLSAIASTTYSLVCLCLPLKVMVSTSTFPSGNMYTCNYVRTLLQGEALELCL